MPAAATKKPPPKHRAATNMDRRGPTRSTQRPKIAAEDPRNKMAMEKIHAISLRFQSPGADWVIPISLVIGKLKVEKAYTWPMLKCTANAAGGTWNRLNPGGATVLSRAKKPVLI